MTVDGTYERVTECAHGPDSFLETTELINVSICTRASSWIENSQRLYN